MTSHAMTIGEVARIARVTQRTLRHYDAIGLLSPAARSADDYRLYTRADLERLFRIRLYVALGVPLREVAALLAEESSREDALARHRDRLAREVARFQAQIRTIDRMLRNESMNPEELFEGFEPERYAQEAEERWGESPQWKESKARPAKYDKAKLAAIQEEGGALLDELAAVLRDGEAPASPRAMDAAEAYRLHIDRWFYPLTREGHVGLSSLYVDDPRFRATFERIEPGLAEFARDAIAANAAR